MTTKVYNVEITTRAIKAIQSLEENIPCFVNYTEKDTERYTVVIRCREEDVAYVERVLAPYV